jgi:hypothetical protein
MLSPDLGEVVQGGLSEKHFYYAIIFAIYSYNNSIKLMIEIVSDTRLPEKSFWEESPLGFACLSKLYNNTPRYRGLGQFRIFSDSLHIPIQVHSHIWHSDGEAGHGPPHPSREF